jgi:hypothetical protein
MEGAKDRGKSAFFYFFPLIFGINQKQYLYLQRQSRQNIVL